MSYKCNCCGKLIEPKISTKNGETISKIEKGEIRGGLGNKILKDNICTECMNVTRLKLVEIDERKGIKL